MGFIDVIYAELDEIDEFYAVADGVRDGLDFGFGGIFGVSDGISSRIDCTWILFHGASSIIVRTQLCRLNGGYIDDDLALSETVNIYLTCVLDLI